MKRPLPIYVPRAVSRAPLKDTVAMPKSKKRRLTPSVARQVRELELTGRHRGPPNPPRQTEWTEPALFAPASRDKSPVEGAYGWPARKRGDTTTSWTTCLTALQMTGASAPSKRITDIFAASAELAQNARVSLQSLYFRCGHDATRAGTVEVAVLG